MNFRIEELNETNMDLWDDFNQEMDDGTFFHTIKWKNVLELLGYNSHYFLVFSGDEPAAICPFFETDIKGFKGVTTLPRSDYNHMVIKDNDPHVTEFIINELKSKAKKMSWSFILFNSLDENFKNYFNDSNLKIMSSGNMVLDLEKLNPDKLWNEFFTAKKGQRRYIERFENGEFQLRSLDSSEGLEEIYKYYINNMKHVNGAESSYSHFTDLFDIYFPENMLITSLHKGDLFAGGAIDFIDPSRKTMYLRYLAFNRELPSKYHVPYYMFWNVIKKADELGFKKICYGGTPTDPNHPTYRLKRNFGGVFENIYSVMLPTSRIFKFGQKIFNGVL